MLSRYARERFLFRLTHSEHADRFVLKGATLFLIWEGEPHRLTRDLDLLGFGSPDPEQLVETMRAVCAVPVSDDGLIFSSENIRAARIREDQEYEGVRVMLEAYLDSARISLQVDVGFGDVVTPAPKHEALPTLLDMEPPRPQVYPRETVVAEKYHAMVRLGIANSRMKDFYDLWFLAESFSFEGPVLAEAIQRTFERRRTNVPAEPPLALTDVFAEDREKSRQWQALIRRGQLGADVSLTTVIEVLRRFLLPPSAAIARGERFEKKWVAGDAWVFGSPA